MQAVRVEWVDSSSETGWQRKNHRCSGGISYCESLGFIIRKNKREIALAQSKSSIGSIAEVMTIPMVCVKKITKLKEE